MRTFVALCALLSLASCFSIAQDTSCGIVWEPVIQLSPDTVDTRIPSIAVQGDTVSVTWWNSGLPFPYMRSVDGGQTFEPMRLLAPDSSGEVGECLVLTAGKRLHGFFTSITNYQTYHIYSDDQGTTWSSPMKLLDTISSAQSYAVLEDTIILFNIKIFQGTGFTISTDNGLTWTRRPQSFAGGRPMFALSPGALHMVKQYTFDSAGVFSEYVVQYRKSTDFGVTWSDSIPLSSVVYPVYPYANAYEPYIAADVGQNGCSCVITGWKDGKFGGLTLVGGSVLGKRSFDLGNSFEPEQRFDERPAGYYTKPEVSANGMFISWIDDLPDGGVRLRASFDNGVTWCPPYAVAPGMIQAITVTGNAIHLVWEYSPGEPPGQFNIYYRRGVFTPSQAHFTVPQTELNFDSTEIGSSTLDSITVTNDGTDPLFISKVLCYDPKFTVTPSGQVIIGPLQSSIFYVTFSPTGPGERTDKIIFLHNTESSPTCVSVHGVGIGYAINPDYQAGWNLVSLPVRTDEVYKLPSMFGYDQSYLPEDTLKRGRGYWAKPDSNMMYSGGVISTDTMAVKAKWNIIGSLTNPVPVASITSIPDSLITSDFYGFTGSGYAPADTLMPGRGYWVKVKADGSLILNAAGVK